MKKIFIEDSRVDSFMRDLNLRVTKSLERDPAIERLVIFAIGESGVQVSQRLYGVLGGNFPRASKQDTDFHAVQKSYVEEEEPEGAASKLDVALSASVSRDATSAVPAAALVEPMPETGPTAAPSIEAPADEKEAKKAKKLKEQFYAVLEDGFGGSTPMLLEDFVSQQDEKTGYLIIDGVCRSGQTLTSVYRMLCGEGKKVWSYSVAVSADTMFIPTWYGCLYESHEVVILTREDATQNTPLYTSKKAGNVVDRLESPALVLRPPLPNDPVFKTTERSLERYTADDRYFDSTTRAKRILVLEWDSVPVGFIAFHVDGETLWIDYFIACQDHKGDKPGIGSAMYYHVENYAKLRGCKQIALWAITKEIKWYSGRGFVTTSHKTITLGKENEREEYQQMSLSLVSETGHYLM